MDSDKVKETAMWRDEARELARVPLDDGINDDDSQEINEIHVPPIGFTKEDSVGKPLARNLNKFMRGALGEHMFNFFVLLLMFDKLLFMGLKSCQRAGSILSPAFANIWTSSSTTHPWTTTEV